MGVGFAVARFGLFLREMGASAAHVTSHTMGLSVLSGVALVGIGVAVNINAIVRHVIVVRELSSGQWVPGKISTSAVALAGLLAIVGIGMALYLLIVR
jgi:putative membrane protein